MTHPIMPPVERLGIDPIEVSHSPRQIAVNRFNQEVIMVFHKAIGMALPIVSLDYLLEDDEKLPPVMIILKNRQTGITPGSDMIDSTRIFDSKWSGHDRR
jgi:hypothetical protein